MFGKHVGKSHQWVVENDPNYAQWVVMTVENEQSPSKELLAMERYIRHHQQLPEMIQNDNATTSHDPLQTESSMMSEEDWGTLGWITQNQQDDEL